MKKILSIFVFIFFALSSKEQTYNPSLHTVTNKAIGFAQATPADGRSMFYDQTNFVYRDYASTSEVLTYLNLSKYRTGAFPIFIHLGGSLSGGSWTGGIRQVWWFRNGVADSNLVRWYTDSTGGGGGITQLNGDVIAGPGSGNVSASLATVTSNTGSFGNAANVAQISFDGKGRQLTAANVPIQIAEAQVTNLTSDLASKLSNITGLLTTGAGYTLSGSGTTGSPYSLNISFPVFNQDSIKHFFVDTGATARNLYRIAWDSVNRKWILSAPASGGGGSGTVTNFIFTNGNGFTGTVGTSTTTPTLSLAPSFTGLTFSNGSAFAAATVNSPLTYSAGALGIQIANTSQSGAISNTDWNTFNTKQSALTFQQSISNSSNIVNLQNDLSTSPELGNQYSYGFDSTGTRNFYLNKYIVAKKTTEIRSLRSGDTSLIYRTIINKVVSDFYYDPSDSTTADDSVMVIASTNGKRFKRYTNNTLYPEWWGAKGDYVTNDGPAFNKMFRWMENNAFGSYEVRFLNKLYYTSDTIKLPRLLQSLPNNNHPSVLISGYGVTIKTDRPICIFYRMPTSAADAQTINDNYRLTMEGIYFQGDRGTSRGQTAVYVGSLYGADFNHLYFGGFDTCMVGRFLTKCNIRDNFFFYESVGFVGASMMDIFAPGDTHTVSATAFNHCKIDNNNFYADGILPGYCAIELLGHDGISVTGDVMQGVGSKYLLIDDWQNTNTSGRTFYDNLWLEATGSQIPIDFLIKDGEVCRISNLKTTYADTLFDVSAMAAGAKVILDNISYGNGFAPIAFKGNGTGNSGQPFWCRNCDINVAATLNNPSRWSGSSIPSNLTTEQVVTNGVYDITSTSDIRINPGVQLSEGSRNLNIYGTILTGTDNVDDWGGNLGFTNHRPRTLAVGTSGFLIDTLAKIKWTTPALNNGQTVALSVPKRNVLSIEANGAVKIPYGITSQQPAADTAYLRMNRDSNSVEFVDTTKTYQELASRNWVRNNLGGGAVSSVSNSDGTLTISPTTGSVVASLALGHNNTWTGVQTQPAPIFTSLTSAGANDSVLTVDPSTGQVHRRSGIFNLNVANGIHAPTSDSIILGGNLNQNTTIGTAGFNFNITGLPTKFAPQSTDSLLLSDNTGKLYKTSINIGIIGGASDADYTAPSNVTDIELPTSSITANRTLTVPNAGNTPGGKLVVRNNNGGASFTWNVTTGSGLGQLRDIFGIDIATIPQKTTMTFTSNGSYWILDATYSAGNTAYSTGSSTQSGNGSTTVFTIPHNQFGITSSSFAQVTPRSSAASGNYYVTTDATNITITYTTAPASGTNNLTWSYQIKP